MTAGRRYRITGLQLISSGVKRNVLNSIYYFGGSFFGLLLGIFTQPIFSRYLEPSDFAVIGYFASVQAFFGPIFSLNLTAYFLASYWDPKQKYGKDLSYHLNFLTIFNCLIGILSYGLIVIYFKLFEVTFPVYPFGVLILLNLIFEKYKAYYLLSCRINKNGIGYFIYTAMQVALTTILSLLFVVVFDGGAVGRMFGQTISVIILGIMAIMIFIRHGQYKFELKFKFPELGKALKFSLPLLLGSYLYYPVSNLDKLLLERLNNTQEFGYYIIGSTIAGYIGTFFVTLYMAFEPDFYKYVSQRNVKEYKKLAIVYILIISLIAIFSILSSTYLVAFLTSNRYLEATKYVNILILAAYFYSIGDIFQQLFISLTVTKLSLVRNAIMAIFAIILYALLIQHMEFLGAAWARVILFVLYILVGLILFVSKFFKQILSLSPRG